MHEWCHKGPSTYYVIQKSEILTPPPVIYIGYSGFSEGIFAQIPRSPEGIWKTPRARQRARGVFQIPDRAEGDLAKIPDEKPE